MIRKIASWFIGYKKKYENSALILVGLSMIVFIIIIVSSLTSVLPNTWRFDPDAYGTVSDWVMVFVTLVTAVFLYKTLNSQTLVQIDQNRIFKIEEQKYLREIRPTINVSYNYHDSDYDDEILNNVFFNLEVVSDKTSHVALQLSDFAGTTLLDRAEQFIGDNQFVRYQFTLKNLNETHFKNSESINQTILNLHFTDCDGNTYTRTEKIEFIKLGFDIVLNSDKGENKLIKKVYIDEAPI